MGGMAKWAAVAGVMALVGCSGGNSTGSSSGGSGATGGSSGGSGGSTGGGAITRQEWCTGYGSAVCTFFSRCNFISTSAPCTFDTAFASGACSAPESETTFDGTRAKACLTFIQSYATASSCDLSKEPDSGLNCDESVIFQAKVEAGGACSTSSSCKPTSSGNRDCRFPERYSDVACEGHGRCAGLKQADGTPCVGNDDCTGGLCNFQFLPDSGSRDICGTPVAIGQPCDFDLKRCDPFRSYCDLNGASGTCRAFRATGASCISDSECGDYYAALCGPSDGGRVCQPTRKRGESCGLDLRCDVSLGCLQGRCSDSVVANGQPCSDMDGVYCDEGSCIAGANGSTCVARAKSGEACGANKPQCASGLRCAQGTCRNRGDVNESCSGASDCLLNLECVAGSCRAAPVLGATCNPAARGTDGCAEGHCDVATSKCVADKAPGSACTPGNFECGPLSCESLSDGGVGCRDIGCVPPAAGGAPRCVTNCN